MRRHRGEPPIFTYGVDTGRGTVGDIIVAVNEKAVRQQSDLTDEIEQIGVGKSVRLSLQEGNQTRTVTLEIVDIGRS